MPSIFSIGSNLMLKLEDLFFSSLHSLNKLNLFVGYFLFSWNTLIQLGQKKKFKTR